MPRRTGSYAPVAIPAPRSRRSGKPHWGLRFVLLLFLAGGVTYFLRPSVPWIHARLTGVEAGVRGVAERYGLVTSTPTSATDSMRGAQPASPTAPAAPAPSRPVVASPGGGAGAEGAPGSRPEVTQLPPRPGAPPAEPGVKPGMQRGTGNRRFVREIGMPRARGPAALTQRPRAAARRGAPVRGMAGRQRFDDPVVTFGDGDETSPPPSEPPPARRGLPQRRARARALARAEARAAAPGGQNLRLRPRPLPPPPRRLPSRPPQRQRRPRPLPPAAPAAPPAPEEKRTVVGEAMRSGDELDRLMATAVVEARGSAPRRPAAAESPRPPARERIEMGAAAAKEPAPPPLSRNEIQTVMKDVQKTMNECYRRHGQQGAADVRVEVTTEGSVTAAVVRGPLANTPTAGCVESKLKAAVFPASRGVTFDYRLMVK